MYIHEFAYDSPIRKLILGLTIAPVTFLANVWRVMALVLLAYYFGVDSIEGLVHDTTGVALFLFALALFFLLDRAIVGAGFVTRRAWRFWGGAADAARS